MPGRSWLWLKMCRPHLRQWLVAVSLVLLPVPTSFALTNGLALVPPMGWNSWNNFGCNINEELIRGMADAMATNGMRAAGYQFINLDDCWAVSRDPNGVIVADPARFPSGIKALADYVHGKGLKLGVYSDHGLLTCGGRPGGYGYEYLDANTYASWGVDYLKYDNCNLPPSDVPQTDYSHMSDALIRSGHAATFSICAWAFASWDPDVGNLWRTTGDISDSFDSMVSKLSPNSQSAFVAGPGRWNDPDMLEVGRGGMTSIEDQSHFTLWCMMAAPLLAGNDLTSMSAQTLQILTNPEAIAVDQDPSGEQGIQVAGSSASQVWSKPLGSGFATKAVALFNNSTNEAGMTANWTQIGLQAGTANVRDLWAHKDLGSFAGGFTTNVPPHGVVLLKVTGTPPSLPGLGGTYLSGLQAAYSYVGSGAMTKDRSIGGNPITLNGTVYPSGLGVHAFSGVEYRLGGIASLFQADIGVDDEVGAGNGSVVFQVYADGMKIFQSAVLHGGDAHQSISLNVSGVNRLTLGVNDADDGNAYDHADWAGARVIVSSTVPAPPQTPAGVAASPGEPIVLSWEAARSAMSYTVKRAVNLAGPYANVAIVNVTGYRDTNVVSGTTYYYVVSATDQAGESGNSNPVSATACIAPGVPQDLTAGVSGSEVNLGWNAALGATTYLVARATTATPYTLIAAGLTTTTFTDTNVNQGATYFYAVAAGNGCNQGAFSSAIPATTAPLPPANLTAVAGGTEIALAWSAPITAGNYNVKRGLLNGGPYVTVATTPSPPYHDTGLVSGTTYYYVVSAVNAGGESANSPQVSVTPCGGGLPSGWMGQDIGSVGLAGSSSSCSDSFVVQGGGADIWGAADAFHFTSTTLGANATLVARVVAVQNTDPWAKAGVMFRNDSSAGAMFADVFVTPGNGVNFQWRAATGGQCASTGAGGVTAPVWVKLDRNLTNFTASYGFDGLTWNVLGNTAIVTSNSILGGLELTAHNNAALCLAGFDHVASGTPRVPVGLSAFGGQRSVVLGWVPSPGAAAYHVKRSATPGGPYTVVATTFSNSCVDSPLANWTTLYYVVSAVNGIGESANSAEASATPRPPPALSINWNGGQAMLTWPAWATGYMAYRATNLLGPVNWQALSGQPGSNSGIFHLPVPPANNAQFFRLQAP